MPTVWLRTIIKMVSVTLLRHGIVVHRSMCDFSFLICSYSVPEDVCLGDTSRKFGSITPRHTIDAILGLKNREKLLEGKNTQFPLIAFDMIDKCVLNGAHTHTQRAINCSRNITAKLIRKHKNTFIYVIVRSNLWRWKWSKMLLILFHVRRRRNRKFLLTSLRTKFIIPSGDREHAANAGRLSNKKINYYFPYRLIESGDCINARRFYPRTNTRSNSRLFLAIRIGRRITCFAICTRFY